MFRNTTWHSHVKRETKQKTIQPFNNARFLYMYSKIRIGGMFVFKKRYEGWTPRQKYIKGGKKPVLLDNTKYAI